MSVFDHFVGLALKVLTFCSVILGDRGARVSGLHSIWDHLTETLKAESSFQTFKGFLNDCFGPKWMCSFRVCKNEE